jgi:hypothetical protein
VTEARGAATKAESNFPGRIQGAHIFRESDIWRPRHQIFSHRPTKRNSTKTDVGLDVMALAKMSRTEGVQVRPVEQIKYGVVTCDYDLPCCVDTPWLSHSLCLFVVLTYVG